MVFLRDKSVTKYFKDEDKDAPFLRHTYRYAGTVIAKKISGTGITPNQVSIIKISFYILTSLFFLLGSYVYLVIAAILLQISFLFDSVDGALARIKSMETQRGRLLEGISDNGILVILFFFIILGAYNATGQLIIWVMGSLALAFTMLIRTTSYYLDFYCSNSEKEMTEKKEGILGKNKGILKHFLFNSPNLFMLISIGAVLNQLPLFLLFIAVYGCVFFFSMSAIVIWRSKK